MSTYNYIQYTMLVMYWHDTNHKHSFNVISLYCYSVQKRLKMMEDKLLEKKHQIVITSL